MNLMNPKDRTLQIILLLRTRLCLNIPDLAFQTLELQLLERAVLPISCRLGGCPWDAEGEKEGVRA